MATGNVQITIKVTGGPFEGVAVPMGDCTECGRPVVGGQHEFDLVKLLPADTQLFHRECTAATS